MVMAEKECDVCGDIPATECDYDDTETIKLFLCKKCMEEIGPYCEFEIVAGFLPLNRRIYPADRIRVPEKSDNVHPFVWAISVILGLAAEAYCLIVLYYGAVKLIYGG